MKCHDGNTHYGMLTNNNLVEEFIILILILAMGTTTKEQGMDLNGNLRKTMYYHVVMSSNDSIFCSPLIAIMPLAKLMVGSNRSDHKELEDAIGYKQSEVGQMAYNLIEQIKEMSGYIYLTIVSTLFVSNAYKHDNNGIFENDVYYFFGTGLKYVDLQDPKKSSKIINDWIAYQISDPINYVEPNEITANSSIVIVNTIHFHGLWEYTFTVREGIFKIPGRYVMHIPMMSGHILVKYIISSKHKVKLIQMPYSGGDISLLLILPLNDDIDDFLKRTLAKPDIWNELFETLNKWKFVSYYVTIPKFLVTAKFDLKKIYKKVGLKKIFQVNNSILTEIVHHRLHVTDAIHAVILEVAETGEGIRPPNYKEPHERFIDIDRPFLYFVMAKKQQLFAGLFKG